MMPAEGEREEMKPHSRKLFLDSEGESRHYCVQEDRPALSSIIRAREMLANGKSSEGNFGRISRILPASSKNFETDESNTYHLVLRLAEVVSSLPREKQRIKDLVGVTRYTRLRVIST